jgi:hypothetical protein
VIRQLVRGLAVTATVFASVVAVLQIGLARPSAAERLAVSVVTELDRARDRGSVMTIGSRQLSAVCTRISRGIVRVRLGDGTEIVAMGTHVLETYRLGGRRALALRLAPDLAAAELVLAGSHALYARELIGQLTRRAVSTRVTAYEGRPAYALLLRARRPTVELVVDRMTLRPLAAVYRSHDLTASSRLLVAPRRSKGC